MFVTRARSRFHRPCIRHSGCVSSSADSEHRNAAQGLRFAGAVAAEPRSVWPDEEVATRCPVWMHTRLQDAAQPSRQVCKAVLRGDGTGSFDAASSGATRYRSLSALWRAGLRESNAHFARGRLCDSGEGGGRRRPRADQACRSCSASASGRLRVGLRHQVVDAPQPTSATWRHAGA